MQQNLADRLRSVMETKGLGQEEIASAAQVSQATVSRALTRPYSRRTKPRKLLEDYLASTECQLHKKGKLPADISSAVAQVWDKTDDHARLIANVIRALEGFSPGNSLKEHARKSSID